MNKYTFIVFIGEKKDHLSVQASSMHTALHRIGAKIEELVPNFLKEESFVISLKEVRRL